MATQDIGKTPETAHFLSNPRRCKFTVRSHINAWMARMHCTMRLLVLSFVLSIKSNWSYQLESMAGGPGEKNIPKIKKRHDDIGYLEQCGVLKSWPEKSERMQVLAFLDASWSSSHTQADMLRQLKERLERSHISGIDFFAINAAFALVPSTDKSPIENAAWDEFEETAENEGQEISIYEMLTEDLANLTGPDIKFIQDTPELGIWNKLKVSRDQILVIDQCGRLTYQVIVPWSILQFAYVKAAILSTYKDQPCGSCDAVSSSAEIANTSEETTAEDTNKHRIYNLNKDHSGLEENQNISESVMNVLNGSEKIIDNSTTEKQSTTKYSVNDTSPTAVPSTRIFKNENSENTDNKSVEMTTTVSSIVEHPEDKIEYDTTTKNDVAKTTKVIADTNFENNVKHVTESIAVTEMDDGNIQNLGTSHSTYDDTDNLEQRIRMDPSNIVVPFKMDDMGNVYGGEARNQESHQENQISRTSVESTEETIVDKENEDVLIPIRIIMHAPHLHEDDDSIRRHEYLVLKFGESNYHGHLDSSTIVKNTGDLRDFPIEKMDMETLINNLTKGSRYELDDTEEQVKYTEVSDESIERHTKHRNHHDKGQKLGGLLFGKNESPGFYGEDSDYWRNYGSEQSYERVEITRPKEDQKYFKETDNVKPMEQVSKSFRVHEENSPEMIEPQNELLQEKNNESNSDERTTISEQIIQYQDDVKESTDEKNEDNKKTTIDHTDQSHNIDSSEEETKNRLIAHYSKLLPWIYYVLDY